jgi:hypothetical protein
MYVANYGASNCSSCPLDKYQAVITARGSTDRSASRQNYHYVSTIVSLATRDNLE